MITMSLVQATAALDAVESVEAFRPDSSYGARPADVTFQASVPSEDGTVVMMFAGHALMVASGGHPDDPEVVAGVAGRFSVWIGGDGALLMATHSKAGRLYPVRGVKARARA